jgi:hypothetical protein
MEDSIDDPLPLNKLHIEHFPSLSYFVVNQQYAHFLCDHIHRKYHFLH